MSVEHSGESTAFDLAEILESAEHDLKTSGLFSVSVKLRGGELNTQQDIDAQYLLQHIPSPKIENLYVLDARVEAERSELWTTALERGDSVIFSIGRKNVRT